MIQETIISILTGDTLVTNICGMRIYPMRAPEEVNTFPLIVYQKINNAPVNSLDGDSNLDEVRIQLTCWADTYKQAQDLAEAVRYVLINSASITALTEDVKDHEDPDTRKYGVILDIAVWETVADLGVDTFLLLEVGDFLLLETGDKIILED